MTGGCGVAGLFRMTSKKKEEQSMIAPLVCDARMGGCYLDNSAMIALAVAALAPAVTLRKAAIACDLFS